MLDYIYKKLYILGLYTARYVKRFFKTAWRFIKIPFKALETLLFALYVVADKFVLKSAKSVHDEARQLRSEAKNTFSKIHGIFKEDKKRGYKTFKYYVGKAFKKHGVVFSVTANIIAPVLSFVILVMTVHYWTSQNFALKITYNNTEIGYVKSESVYLEASKRAEDRLSTAIATSDSGSIIKSAQYEIAPVKLTNLNDAESISNEIIEHSDSNITNACGIYIDGEFLCAIKNETDAATVFDNILAAYATDDNGTPGFVEDISYVQGLYPDNDSTIWDAERLSEKLSTKKSEASYYTVQAGDTVSGIAQKLGIRTSELFALNPGKAENIHAGDQLLVSREVNFVRVQVTKTETRTVSIPYTSETEQSDSLYKGIKKTVQQGRNGQQVITELVSYIDGVRVSTKEISRVTTLEPVTEKIQVGTKSYASSSYGSVSVKSYGGRFVWPSTGAYSISSGFGGARRHGGIDIVKPGGNSTGATIVAAGSGRVISASYHPSWGYNVLIDHGNGLQTRYAHMIPGSFKVSSGQSVSAGQPIGNIGSSGNVTGPHLHFEVYQNGRRVNPMPYLGR